MIFHGDPELVLAGSLILNILRDFFQTKYYWPKCNQSNAHKIKTNQNAIMKEKFVFDVQCAIMGFCTMFSICLYTFWKVLDENFVNRFVRVFGKIMRQRSVPNLLVCA